MKTNKKKKCLWTIENENLLIKLWKERLHDLRNTRRSKPIYEEIRNKLNRKGCFVGVEEVKHKVHNLTTKYKKEKQNRSSGYSPTEWEFYDVLDDMFSTYQPGNIINLEEESSKSFSEDYAITENVSKEFGKNYRQEYASENFFTNEDEENDPEETASTPVVDRRLISNHNEHHTTYFKDISQNLKLMVEKVLELSDNIQSWEEKGNAQLAQISQILKKQTTRTHEDYANVSVSSRKRKLSQHDDDDAMDDIFRFDKFLSHGEMVNENEMRMSAVRASASRRNKIVLDDYLKTQELERQFLTEKHNIQMEILKLELEAKRNECLRDA